MVQKTTDSGKHLLLMPHLAESERMENVIGISRSQLSHQNVGRRAIEHRNRTVIIVGKLPDILSEGCDILTASGCSGDDPGDNEGEAKPSNLRWREAEPRRKQQQKQTGETSAKSPDDGIDEGLDLKLY